MIQQNRIHLLQIDKFKNVSFSCYYMFFILKQVFDGIKPHIIILKMNIVNNFIQNCASISNKYNMCKTVCNITKDTDKHVSAKLHGVKNYPKEIGTHKYNTKNPK